MVSAVAAKKSVRDALTKQQKLIGINGGIIAEGRDIGTTVFPEADLKIYLTATAHERAKRRAFDLKLRGFPVPDIKELENQILKRDESDSTREFAPLVKAKDATELITDGMDINEVIDAIIELFRLKIPSEVWPITE